MSVCLKQGPSGEVRGNTGTLKGYAGIVGDIATFTPDDMDTERCKVILKFTNPGTVKIQLSKSLDSESLSPGESLLLNFI